jgi:hypothetical protein
MEFAKTGMLSTALLFVVVSTQANGAVFSTTTIRTTCPTPTTVGAYVSNGVVCDTGNMASWLEFSNFNSTSADNLPIQGLANGANQGFYFPVNLAGPATFRVGYDIEAINTLMSGINLHVTASGLPRTDASVTMYVCVGQPAGCPVSEAKVLTLNSTSLLPYETVYFDSLASKVGVTFVGNVDPQALLSQFESIIITDVPEPTTLAMLGAGLLGLGLFTSRKKVPTA